METLTGGSHVPHGTVRGHGWQAPSGRLLDAAIDYVAENGIADLSLRELAAALGTSHRMLIHHFGSKRRPVGRDRPRGRGAPARLAGRTAARPAAGPRGDADLVAAHLRPVAVAQRAAVLRALRPGAAGPPGHTAELLDGIVERWLEPATEINVVRGVPREPPAATLALESRSRADCCWTCWRPAIGRRRRRHGCVHRRLRGVVGAGGAARGRGPAVSVPAARGH